MRAVVAREGEPARRQREGMAGQGQQQDRAPGERECRRHRPGLYAGAGDNPGVTHRIATHNGTFHADDVFGVAVLALVFPQHEIIRTRDPQRIAAADFAVDVGGEWDAATGRFDHHQRGFDGGRTRVDEDGKTVPAEGYASAGLVWREYGAACVQKIAASLGHTVDEAAAKKIADDVDSALVRYLDLVDTGAESVSPGVIGLSSQVSLLNSNWLEEKAGDRAANAQLQLERFHEAMALVRRGLERFVQRGIGQQLAADKVRAAQRLSDGRVLLLADGGMPWTRVVVEEMPDVRFVIYPDSDNAQYQIRTVPTQLGSFDSRMDLPRAWGGLRDAELAAVTGVADAVFCHTKLFIGGARSLAGAQKMAELALA